MKLAKGRARKSTSYRFSEELKAQIKRVGIHLQGASDTDVLRQAVQEFAQRRGVK